MRFWVIVIVAICCATCENALDAESAGNLPFSCKVYTEKWQATELKGTLETADQKKIVTISATRDEGNGLQDVMEIRIIGFHGVDTYLLAGTDAQLELSMVYKGIFYAGEGSNMKVEITDYDIRTKNISGRFMYELITDSGNVVPKKVTKQLLISDGKFGAIQLKDL